MVGECRIDRKNCWSGCSRNGLYSVCGGALVFTAVEKALQTDGDPEIIVVDEICMALESNLTRQIWINRRGRWLLARDQEEILGGLLTMAAELIGNRFPKPSGYLN